MGGGQTDRRLGEKLTKLGRGPAELPKDLVSGGNILEAGPWCLVFFDVEKKVVIFCSGSQCTAVLRNKISYISISIFVTVFLQQLLFSKGKLVQQLH